MVFENVKVRKEIADMLRGIKKETSVPIISSVEKAIVAMYGEPKKKQSKK